MTATQTLIATLTAGQVQLSDVYTHESGVQYFFETYSTKATLAIAKLFKKATVENFIKCGSDFSKDGISFHLDRNPKTGELGNVYAKKLVKIN